MNGYLTNRSLLKGLIFMCMIILATASLGHLYHNNHNKQTNISPPKIAENDGFKTDSRQNNLFWNGTIIISEDLVITSQRLIVEAGTIVKVEENAEIILGNAMECRGTRDEPVTFEKNSPDKWGGIHLTQAKENCSFFNHTIISGALAGIRTNNSDIAITNSSFVDCTRDIVMELNSHIMALNCTIDQKNVDIIDANSELTITWFLNIEILTWENEKQHIPVEIFNRHGVSIGSQDEFLTDELGRINYINCTESVMKKSGREIFTSHMIKLPSHMETQPNREYVYMDCSKTIKLPLEYYAKTSSIVKRVSTPSLKATVCDLLNFPDRYQNTTGHKEVENYLVQRFSEVVGENVGRHTFVNNGTQFTNIICTQDGIGTSSEDEYVIVAHYDTSSPSNMGADDDASGVAVLLECARILSSYKFNSTIKYVALDGGVDRLGSIEFANNANITGANIKAVLSLDRIGYSGGNNLCGIWKNQHSNSIVNNILGVNVEQNIDLDILPQDQIIEEQNDYKSFWDRGYKAVGISESDSPVLDSWWPEYWPENDDNYSLLDYNYMGKIAQLCSAVLFEYGGVKLYSPSTPIITSTNITHMQRPKIEWSKSFDFMGGNVIYHLSIRDTNGTYLVSDLTTTETEYHPDFDMIYGHDYLININGWNDASISSSNSTITLSIINHEPTFTQLENKTAYQNLPLLFTLNATDEDIPRDNLYFDINHSTFTGFTLNHTTGQFQWTPNNTHIGIHFIEFRVSDGIGGKNTMELKLNVINVNDAPKLFKEIGILKIPEDTPEKLYFNLTEIFVDIDMQVEQNEKLNFTFSGNTSTIIRVENNNSVYISMKDNYFGRENITIIATDKEGLQASCMFELNVTPVNDAPRVQCESPLTYSEGDLIILDPSVHDVEGDNITLTYSGATDGPSWQTDYYSNGTHTINITASDGKDNSTFSLIINIIDVKVNPVAYFSVPGIVAPEKFITLNATNSIDMDGQIVDYYWNFGDGKKISGMDAVVTHKYEKSGEYTVVLTITDNDGQTGTISQIISVEYPSNTQNIFCSISIILAIVVVGAFLLSRIGRKDIR